MAEKRALSFSLTVKVSDYGATGDGSTDDTTAIANALTRARAIKGRVHFEPSKTYIISAALDPMGCTVEAYGATLKLKAGITAPNLFAPSGTGAWTLLGGTLDGNKANNTDPGADTAGCALYQNSTTWTGVVWRDVTVLNFWRPGIYLSSASGATDAASVPSRAVLLDNVSFTGCKYALFAYALGDVRIRNCSCDGAAADGFWFALCARLDISGCRVSTSGGHGIVTSYDLSDRIVDNVCTSNTGGGIVLGGGSVTNTESRYPVIAGNTCRANTLSGISLDPTKTGSVAAVVPMYGVVSANVCQGNTIHGIFLQNAQHVAVNGNTCRNNTVDGIGVSTADTAIAGNHCTGNGGVAIRLNGNVSYPNYGRHRLGVNYTDGNTGGGYSIEGAYVTDVAFASGMFNVKDFGAKGDNTADDTTAIRACIRAASWASATYEHPTVFFPNGVYRITADGIFSDLDKTTQYGMRFQGAGRSRLRLICGGGTKWFYNNGATARHAFASWSDLSFETDDTTRALGNGFRFQSAGNEQAFTFTRCHFSDMNEAFACYGSANADSVRLFGGRLTNLNTALRLELPQSVLHEWYGVAIELCYGDMFYVGAGGGGDIKLYGGSIIMDNDGGSTTPHWLIKVDPSIYIGPGNARFTFNGVKTELRSLYSGLVKALGEAGSPIFTFRDCNLYTTHATAHEMLRIGNYRRVTFDNCTLSDAMQYVMDCATGPGSAINEALLSFVNCEIPPDLTDKITWPNTPNYGRATGQGCRLRDTAPGSRQALDFDLNWRGSGLGSPSIPMKRAVIQNAAFQWPNSAGNERTIKLPANSIITRIVVSRPASGASATTYGLKVGNGDKTTVYAVSISASGQFKDLHTIDVQPMVDVGTASNTRTLRLWSSPVGDATDTFGGFAWVEYL